DEERDTPDRNSYRVCSYTEPLVQISEKPEGVSFSPWEKVARRSASPTGRSIKKTGPMRAKIDALPNPHPALRATLSRRERDTPLQDAQAEIRATQTFEPTTRL